MQQRTLGSENFQVSALGLGCMGMSFAYGQPSEEREAINTLYRAFELGIDFIDTAEVYGPYTNEALIGRALKGYQGKIKVATKFGFHITEGSDPRQRIQGVNSRPQHIRAVAEASLQRLGLETIDLFYQHRLDPAVPIEEVVGTLADLVREGKIRHIGLSEVSASTLRRAQAVHPVTAVQNEYSLWSRDPEQGVLAACRELNVGFVPYSPLGRGFLSGKLPVLGDDDFRSTLPRFSHQAREHNQRLVGQLAAMAAGYDATAAQLALAWVLAQGDFIVPIPGVRQIRHLEENCAATDIRLSAEDMTALNALFVKENIIGERYTEQEFALADSSL